MLACAIDCAAFCANFPLYGTANTCFVSFALVADKNYTVVTPNAEKVHFSCFLIHVILKEQEENVDVEERRAKKLMIYVNHDNKTADGKNILQLSSNYIALYCYICSLRFDVST